MVHYVRKPKLPNEINGHRVTYQSDRITLEKQAADNPFTYGAMWKKIDNMGGKWLTHAVLKQNIKDEGFIILQFRGMSNSGKSWLAFAKAFQLRNILLEHGFENPRIHLVHNWSEVLHAISEANEGDIIFCDEETTVSGQESLTEANSMRNILKACRAKKINFFFIDPDPLPKPNVHAWVYVVGKIKGIYSTMSIVHDGQGTLVGLDFHRLPMNDETFSDTLEEYQKIKMDNIQALIDAHGRVGSDFAGQQEKEAQVLYELAIDHQAKTGLKMNLKRLKVLMVKHQMTGGTGEYREQIQTIVMDKIKTYTVQMSDVDTHHGVLLRYTYEDIPISEAFWTEYKEELYKQAKRQNKSKSDVDFFIEYVEAGCPKQDEFDISQSQVSKALSRITEGHVSGLAYERWFQRKHPDWEYAFDETGKGIDILSPTEIIECKATTRDSWFWFKDSKLKKNSRLPFAAIQKFTEGNRNLVGYVLMFKRNIIRKYTFTEFHRSEE